MTTSLPKVTWVQSSSTVLKYSRTSAFVSTSFSSLIRVQPPLRLHPFPVYNYPSSSQSRRSSSSSPAPPPPQQQQEELRSSRQVSAASSASDFPRGVPVTEKEEVFFDGGVHVGDLVVNLLFGFTLVWLPLTLTAVFRGLFLRYRFTDLRVTVQSGLLGGDRKEFSYDAIKDVKFVPRFIGEWGDMAIELKDGTNVDIRGVPRFREIAKYVEQRAAGRQKRGNDPSSSSPVRGGAPKKGFS